jgi:hypothetical protein
MAPHRAGFMRYVSFGATERRTCDQKHLQSRAATLRGATLPSFPLH